VAFVYTAKGSMKNMISRTVGTIYIAACSAAESCLYAVVTVGFVMIGSVIYLSLRSKNEKGDT